MASFKAIELEGQRRTGRELRLEADSRQAAVDALLAELRVAPEQVHVDPTRTLVQVGEARWSIVAIQPSAGAQVSPSLRRGGAKHKQVH